MLVAALEDGAGRSLWRSKKGRRMPLIAVTYIGGAGIFLFGRELFTDSAFVARGGCDVESKCEMGGIGAFLRREALLPPLQRGEGMDQAQKSRWVERSIHQQVLKQRRPTSPKGAWEEGHPENLFLYVLDAGVVIHAEGHHPSRRGFVRGPR